MSLINRQADRYVANENVGQHMYKDDIENLLNRAFKAGAEMFRLEAAKLVDDYVKLVENKETKHDLESLREMIKYLWR